MSINFNSLGTAKNKSVIPFLYQFEFFTLNHLLTFSVTTSSLPHLFPLMTSLQAPKRRNSEGARSGLCGVWGRTVHPCFVIVSTILVRSNSLEMLLQGFESLNVQVWVIGLSMWHNAYRSHPLCIPKNSGHDLPCWSDILKILFLRSWMMPFHSLFVCSSKCWTMFQTQWWSVTESFHHQPRTGRAHLNSPHSCMIVG